MYLRDSVSLFARMLTRCVECGKDGAEAWASCGCRVHTECRLDRALHSELRVLKCRGCHERMWVREIIRSTKLPEEDLIAPGIDSLNI